MTSIPFYAVIMAGGVGTRFWPASRKEMPKQFLPVASARSLIAETSDRLKGLVPPERQIVVTAAAYVGLVRKQLSKLPPENVLGEPIGRNTAPCVAWAAHEIERREKHSVQCVLPSDHVIRPAQDFRAALSAAVETANSSGALCTFGIRPTFPATGYGYIEAGKKLATIGNQTVHAVKRFVEKPNHKRAESFLAKGNFSWNSGMFVWRTDAIVAALEAHVPALWRAISNCKRTQDVVKLYPRLESISIDVAVMEKQKDVRVIPATFGWSDVGSWTALPDVAPLDAQSNCVAGGARLLAQEARRCITYGAKGEILALLGVEDLVVVRAGKATLVCPRARAQDVKAIVARLEKEAPGFL